MGNILNRLVVGTANWTKEYNGHKVSDKEQQLIMEYMKEVGIEWLDVATAYGTQDISRDFNKIVKSNENIPTNYGDILLSHTSVDFDVDFHDGLSTYIPESCIYEGLVVEFPYSIMNRHFKFSNTNTFIARSIFCKGKALKYFSPQECIDFVLMNPRIDKVIIGVDSADQLRENVAHLVKMEKFTHNEEVDTRKFERKDL